MEEKMKYDMSKSLRANHKPGYVKISDKRETIKYRTVEDTSNYNSNSNTNSNSNSNSTPPTSIYPTHPEHFQRDFLEACNTFQKISKLCFLSLSTHPIHQQMTGADGIANNVQRELISEEERNAILDMTQSMSIMALIHYFANSPMSNNTNNNSNNNMKNSGNNNNADASNTKEKLKSGKCRNYPTRLYLLF